MGRNGSGKTNFLEAVKYALTGEAGGADQKLQSFIHDPGPAYPEVKSATVTLDFIKDGVEGTITRKVTRSNTSRELHWDGQKITKAAEVAAVLNDVLGVDKYVLDNAVFIPQGDLDKLLFGTQAEREERFIKIMLLGHFSNVASICDTKARLLGKDVVDQTALRDELSSQIRRAEDELADAEAALRRCKDVTAEINQFEEVCNLGTSIANLEADLKDIENEYNSAVINRNSFIRKEGTYLPSIAPNHSGREGFVKEDINQDWGDQLQAEITRREASRDTLSIRYNDTLSDKTVAELLGDLRSRWKDTSIRLKSVDLRLANTKEWTRGELDEARTLLKTLESKNDLNNKLLKLDEEIQNCSAELITISGKSAALEEHTLQRQAELDEVNKGLSLSNFRISGMESGLNCRTEDESVCPLCRQQWPDSKSLSEYLSLERAAMETLHAKQRTLTKEYSELKAESEREQRKLHELTAIRDRCERDRRSCISSLAELQQGGNASCSLEEARSNYETIEREFELWNNYKRERDLAAAELERINERGAKFTEEEKQRAKQFSEEKLKALSAELDKEQESIEQIKATLVEYRRLQDKEDDLKRRADTLRLSVEDLRRKAANIKLMPLTANISAAKAQDIEDKTILRIEVMNELRAKQREHDLIRGQVDAVTKQANELQYRMRSLETREDANKARLEVIEELQTLKNAFSRTGIPREYIDYHYAILVKIAQDILEKLGTPFDIMLDPEKPVSLLFKRNDDGSGAEFPQAKLSGGQRINLSVAFLLAIQKRLVPELGFLALDEPTTHVDEDGRAALRDMLAQIGPMLHSSESQVWVIDHDEILSTAFGTTIRFEKTS